MVLRVRPSAVIVHGCREGTEIFLALEWANRNLQRAERRKSRLEQCETSGGDCVLGDFHRHSRSEV